MMDQSTPLILIESMKRTVRLTYGVAILYAIGATAGYLYLLPIACLLALYAYLLAKTHSRAVAIAGFLTLVATFGGVLITTVIEMLSNQPSAGMIALAIIPWILPLLLVFSSAQAILATFRLHAVERTSPYCTNRGENPKHG
jgi:hypothetical protein